MKSFILLYTDAQVSEQAVLRFLDKKAEVLNWLNVFPNTVFLVSDEGVETLTNMFQKRFPNSLFIIIEYSTRRANGLLNDEAWDFLNNPRQA